MTNTTAPFRWAYWVDEGSPFVAHRCRDAVHIWRCPPPWRLRPEGGIEPSFNCSLCGDHLFLHAHHQEADEAHARRAVEGSNP